MANIKYLRCSKCGNPATPRKYNPSTGELAETGTSTLMRCRDCCDQTSALANQAGYASMCRDCCPTGHGTHWIDKSESEMERARR